jgi:hypothetical protein
MSVSAPATTSNPPRTKTRPHPDCIFVSIASHYSSAKSSVYFPSQFSKLFAKMPTMLGGIGLGVSDMAKSVHFYTTVLGMVLSSVPHPRRHRNTKQ